MYPVSPQALQNSLQVHWRTLNVDVLVNLAVYSWRTERQTQGLSTDPCLSQLLSSRDHSQTECTPEQILPSKCLYEVLLLVACKEMAHSSQHKIQAYT